MVKRDSLVGLEFATSPMVRVEVAYPRGVVVGAAQCLRRDRASVQTGENPPPSRHRHPRRASSHTRDSIGGHRVNWQHREGVWSKRTESRQDTKAAREVYAEIEACSVGAGLE